MKTQITQGLIISLIFLFGSLFALRQNNHSLAEDTIYSGDSDRIAAVKAFAKVALNYAQDNFRDSPTPLFVDGLSVEDYKPVTWVHEGEKWIPSNLANQQNFFRTLVGLSELTGDDSYSSAAQSAMEYGFKNLQHENGLIYWGGHRFLDLSTGKAVGEGYRHEFKFTLPFYEWMYEVDSSSTLTFIRAFWNAHILDWGKLDMNRHGHYEDELGELWNHQFEGADPFFEGDGLTFINAGTDLIYAGLMLYHFTGEKGALDWSLKLAKQYVNARHPETKLGVYQYSKPVRRDTPPNEGPLPTTSNYGDRAENQFSADFGEVAKEGYILRNPASIYGNNAIVQLQMAEQLGKEGKELLEWTIEGLLAWAKYGYDAEKNLAKPILADGTDLTGYTIKRDGYFGKRGQRFQADESPMILFWSFALAYRLSGDERLWQTMRAMGKGHGLGDLGEVPGKLLQIEFGTAQSDPLAIFALMEIIQSNPSKAYKELAESIGDNILEHRYVNNLFVPSEDHLYASLSAVEPLALVSLEAMLRGEADKVPRYNGGSGYFHGPHDDYGRTTDKAVLWSAQRE
ncbi:pectate lyase [Pleomorphovibrio marinus]|uniref:pectate lyase n=1 Tax=Pleomorphovibrio marinus TaxID=2164132 RepID=UPI000E0BB425|nr:pectate lyase [Pleomorphovibrio marinus]